jgi:hypothetical protein
LLALQIDEEIGRCEGKVQLSSTGSERRLVFTFHISVFIKSSNFEKEFYLFSKNCQILYYVPLG